MKKGCIFSVIFIALLAGCTTKNNNEDVPNVGDNGTTDTGSKGLTYENLFDPKSKIDIDDIKYIIPHQSNLKIMKSIANKLKIDSKKVYTNIENVGNTFCASIPIALDEMFEKHLLKKGDKIILLGYGGGLNTGSILMEV